MLLAMLSKSCKIAQTVTSTLQPISSLPVCLPMNLGGNQIRPNVSLAILRDTMREVTNKLLSRFGCRYHHHIGKHACPKWETTIAKCCRQCTKYSPKNIYIKHFWPRFPYASDGNTVRVQHQRYAFLFMARSVTDRMVVVLFRVSNRFPKIPQSITWNKNPCTERVWIMFINSSK